VKIGAGARANLHLAPDADEANADEDPYGDWLTLKDAYAPHPPQEHIVGKMLPIPSLDILYGPPGSLKTMLLMDLAAHVASGQPWLPGKDTVCEATPIDVTQAPVVWLDMDNGRNRIDVRWAAICRALNLPDTTPIFYQTFPNPPFIASDPDCVQWLMNAITHFGARLTCIDNLGAISGGADENSAEMLEVMYGLRLIVEQARTAMVAIHHSNKASDVSERSHKRKGNALRGHSSIEGAVDLALLVSRGEGDDSITIQSTKTRDRDVPAFCALWDYEHNDEGDLKAARFYGLGPPEEPTDLQSKACKAIMATFQNGMTQSGIVASLKNTAKIGRGTTIAALNSLVRTGYIMSVKESRNNAISYHKLIKVGGI
jgi:hypothetical protein